MLYPKPKPNTKTLCLSSLKPGEHAKILGFEEEGTPYCLRLMASGLLPGNIVQVLRMAPLGDPIEIQMIHPPSRSAFCLRKEDACLVQIERLIHE